MMGKSWIFTNHPAGYSIILSIVYGRNVGQVLKGENCREHRGIPLNHGKMSERPQTVHEECSSGEQAGPTKKFSEKMEAKSLEVYSCADDLIFFK